MAARGGRTGLLGATHGGFAGRRAQTWFAAICARWGVACTAPDGGRRSILQAISVFLNLKNDSLSPSVDIIRRQIAVTCSCSGRALCSYVCAQIQHGAATARTTRALAGL
jgi:hypothetical protein